MGNIEEEESLCIFVLLQPRIVTVSLDLILNLYLTYSQEMEDRQHCQTDYTKHQALSLSNIITAVLIFGNSN